MTTKRIGYVLVALATLLGTVAQADLLVDRAGNGVFGKIELAGKRAIVTVETGKLAYDLDNLLFLSNDPQVTSYWTAYLRAQKQGAALPVQRRLLELAVQAEPANRPGAQKALAALRQAEEARRQPVVTESRGPNVIVPIAVESSNFRGFIEYGNTSTVNGGQVVNRIPQPVFESTVGSTTVIVGSGGRTTTTK